VRADVEKVTIEKNTVRETLIVSLYGRKMSSEKFPELCTDVFV
jgi:O-methyltransferase involved in polyketide biosynthesis